MQAKNFRIGNLLTSKQWRGVGAIEGIETAKNSFEIKVKGYVHKWEEGKYFDLTPIEITTDWLLKFGFEKKSDEVFALDTGAFYFEWICGEGMYFESVGIDIEYVHELQNLFFATRLEELELKDKG